MAALLVLPLAAAQFFGTFDGRSSDAIGSPTAVAAEGASVRTTVAAAALATSPQNPRPSAVNSDAVPVKLSIPAIGVNASIGPLSKRADGALEPPARLRDAGWYTESSVPGSTGPAVIAGHVDDTRDAGVFARLHELEAGAEILVRLSDGTEQRFRMTGSVDTAKAEFPTEAVYGPTPAAALRIVTCNLPYDFEAMRYRNNLVVFATAIL